MTCRSFAPVQKSWCPAVSGKRCNRGFVTEQRGEARLKDLPLPPGPVEIFLFRRCA